MHIRSLTWAVATAAPIESSSAEESAVPPAVFDDIDDISCRWVPFYAEFQFYIYLVLFALFGYHLLKFRRFYVEFFRVMLWAALARTTDIGLCITLHSRTGNASREISLSLVNDHLFDVDGAELQDIECAPANADEELIVLDNILD